MVWLRKNARGVVLNLIALVIFGLVMTQGSTGYWATDTFDPGLESGKWAIRFLLICLLMTPLSVYFRWTSAIKLRKPAGLWAFGFALPHVYFYLAELELAEIGLRQFVAYMPPFIMLGLLALVVLAALAITSNRRSMRRLGKNWKRLHRLVYVAGLAVTTHAILAVGASKKILIRDPQAAPELNLYLALLIILLVVRIPQVRRLLKRFTPRRRQALALNLQITPVGAPKYLPEYRPLVDPRESEFSAWPLEPLPNARGLTMQSPDYASGSPAAESIGEVWSEEVQEAEQAGFNWVISQTADTPTARLEVQSHRRTQRFRR